MLAIFLLFGGIDTSIKFFKISFPVRDEGLFLVIIFFSAALWSWIYLIVKKKKIRKREIVFGTFLGVPNFFSTFFLLKALESIPAYISFPVINVGLIVSSGIVGHLYFKERLSLRKRWLTLAGIVAVIFLTS